MKISIIAKSFIDVLLGKVFPERKAPFSIYWILTDRCSNNCRYCNYHNGNHEELRKQELPTEKIKEILREMAEMGCRKIQFTGGEPLLRDDIVEIVKTAKECGIYVGLSTSGVGLRRQSDIYKYLDMAFISLDGPADIHNESRGGNFFEHAKSAIDFFKKHKVKVFTTAVLTKLNIASVDYILDFIKNNKIIGNFVLCNSQPELDNTHIPARADIASFLLDNNQSKEILTYLKHKKNAGYSIGNTISYFDYLLDWSDYGIRYKNEKHQNLDCYAGRFFGFLFPNGDLYPCGDLYWRVKPVSAAREGFKKAFSSLKKPECQSCLNGCYIEQNLVYSLKWSSIIEWGLDKLRGRW